MQAYSAVSVNPQLGMLVKIAAQNDQYHIDAYGSVVHRLSWGPQVAGKNVATMADCQDQTKFGLYNTRNSTVLTEGPAHENLQITFQRIGLNWKVAAVLDRGETC